jgi:hypothetical protein
MKSLPALLIALPLMQASATAAVLFSDTFDRADSRNIDASLTGITDNTGSSLAADAAYSQSWLDPNSAAPTYGVQDGVATNGGGAQILSNQLRLAVGAGTSNAYVNHNFINASILAAGGFSVTIDVTGYNQSGSAEQGGGFAIGMSQAEAASARDAWDVNPSMTGAFNIGGVIGNTVPGVIVSDFWIAIRGNNSLAWGGNTGTVSGVTGLAAKTGTINVDFEFADFTLGSLVNYEVSLNSVTQGSGSFAWSGTNENYIGIDARDNTFVGFDNFSVNTIPEPTSAAMMLLGAAGFLRRRR